MKKKWKKMKKNETKRKKEEKRDFWNPADNYIVYYFILLAGPID
jgi:hypothetical protein